MNLALLSQVTEEFAAYLSEVADGDLTATTPCELWTVEDLARHMIDANISFAVAIDPDVRPRLAWDSDALRETTYRDSARCVIDALENVAETHIAAHRLRERFEGHITNTLIHTWDLARAIELDFDLPEPPILDMALRTLRRLPERLRGSGRPFAEIPQRPARSVMDEVLLLSGRSPDWPADDTASETISAGRARMGA